MLRLSESERALASVGAVAEHVAGLTATAAAFQLQPDIPSGSDTGVPLVALLDEPSAGDAAATLEEIRLWTHQTLGIDRIPAIWRALAHQPQLLDATWRKDRLVFDSGILDELVTTCAALAVAQFRQSAYWIPYFTHLLRSRCHLDDRAVVEVAGAVMHYVSYNTISHGMRLDPPAADLTVADVLSGGPLEHIVPPGA